MTAHLAVVLPGGNNNPWTAPVLLPSLALEQRGAVLERITYGEPRARGLGLEESAAFNAAVLEQLAQPRVRARRPLIPTACPIGAA